MDRQWEHRARAEPQEFKRWTEKEERLTDVTRPDARRASRALDEHIPKMGHKESLYPVRKNTLHLFYKTSAFPRFARGLANLVVEWLWENMDTLVTFSHAWTWHHQQLFHVLFLPSYYIVVIVSLEVQLRLSDTLGVFDGPCDLGG
jgi:hypothetical protein